MALQTNAGIMPDRILAARDPMRIVTRSAFHFSAALQKAPRLPQPVNRAYRLEFTFVPSAGRVLEINCEIRQRLSGNIRERAAVESLEYGRKPPARRFEVALHTHFQPPFESQL